MISTLLATLLATSEDPSHQVLEIRPHIVPLYNTTAPPRSFYESIKPISWKCKLKTIDDGEIVSSGRFEEAIFEDGRDVAYERKLVLESLGIHKISGQGTTSWSYSNHDYRFQISTSQNLYNIEMGAIEPGKRGWMRLESAPNNGDDSIVEFRFNAMGFCESEISAPKEEAE